MTDSILLDLDGVLVNFIAGAMKAHNISLTDLGEWPPGEWHLDKIMKMTPADFFAPLERDESFWFNLDNRGWLHPFDAKGKRRGYREVPKKITQLVDDPFRSLAGALRRAGGFAKEVTPFAEFTWADFLRRRIGLAAVGADFASAISTALQLARSPAANHLPGWCGAS